MKSGNDLQVLTGSFGLLGIYRDLVLGLARVGDDLEGHAAVPVDDGVGSAGSASVVVAADTYAEGLLDDEARDGRSSGSHL